MAAVGAVTFMVALVVSVVLEISVSEVCQDLVWDSVSLVLGSVDCMVVLGTLVLVSVTEDSVAVGERRNELH